MNGDILELIKLAQNGDDKAVEIIIEQNSGLIWSVVKRFLNRGYDAEDLFQIGSIGLLKCIKKFDTNYEVKFSTYAVPMIMGEIKRFLRDDGLIKVSRPLKEIATKAKYMRDTLTKDNNEEPTINELAIAIDVSVEDLVLALDADREVESLYSTVYQNDGKSVYLIDKLELKNDNQEKIVDSIVLKDIIEKLDPREKTVINLRYFEDKTQSQVAKLIGVSQVQVSRIEKKVLAKIREKFG
ncbi:RNA polymerase sporulation sigma factor SigF [[Clostridium] colinum]|uniref:RNA polymerase sporulation sigma factor SigF n=1 Tax=[Clostridium] colinum TaxID=36835 RepID=UPI0020253A79|nr:RNA polymerase sporulation sigma factor SigF [[Clostridium] colinum]